MSWSVDPISSAGATAPDVDEAVRMLMDSISCMRNAYTSDAAYRELQHCAAGMRVRMLDEAREVLRSGEQWSATVGSLRVLLIPRRGPWQRPGAPRPGTSPG